MIETSALEQLQNGKASSVIRAVWISTGDDSYHSGASVGSSPFVSGLLGADSPLRDLQAKVRHGVQHDSFTHAWR
ncbi:hypothetical protein [Bradyrhizobium iriomotense]|uniref:hypothetical protein n=1 Tax=Bradyrhizobium iriomotense TaxID=441950 RepID=UPI0024E157A8|nr:hypothetical protein [Bradyrhizobium iriomotense]